MNIQKNAQKLLDQIQNDEIFEVFNRKNRDRIWNELISTKHFISFFRNFFKNVNYLNALTDSVKLLIDLASNDIIFIALSRTLNQESYDVAIQTAKSSYRYQSASSLNKVNLSWRQLMIFTMRNYRNLFKRSKKKNLLIKSIFAKDDNILNAYAHLANCLEYDTFEIAILRENMHIDLSSSINHLSLFVTDESEVSKKSKRCDFSIIQVYSDDWQWQCINNLHAKRMK